MPQSEPGAVNQIRIPLATTIGTRDSTLSKDAISYNCFAEAKDGNEQIVVRRFGQNLFRQLTAGTGLGLFSFHGSDVAVIGTTCYLAGVSIGTVNASGGPYQFVLTNEGAGFFMKNTTNAYWYNGTSLAAISDANYPTNTVWGVAYVDGYVFVMDINGIIWNSVVNTPATWGALLFISANAVAGAPVAICSYLNLVVAFIGNGAVFFYDAAVPSASPLLPVPNATINVGCYAGPTLAFSDNTVLFMGQTAQRGRSIYLFNGLIPQPVSDAHIDRILNNVASVSQIYSYFIKIMGHAFYVLTLEAGNVTLVLDLNTSKWHVWSSTIAGTALTITNYSVSSSGVLTATAPAHGLTNGAVILANGGLNAISNSLLGVIVPRVIDSNTLSWDVSLVAEEGNAQIFFVGTGTITFQGALGGNIQWTSSNNSVNPALPFSITPYLQNYFSQLFYANTGTSDLLLHGTSGLITQINESSINDNGSFIYNLIRTPALDFGNNKDKYYSAVEVIADKLPSVDADGIVFVSYSDDDFQSYGYFRPAILAQKRVRITRCGKARRRTWSLLYIANESCRFYALEPEIDQS